MEPGAPWRGQYVMPVAAVVSLLGLVLLAPAPSYPRIWVVLSNTAHAPVFAAVAVLVLRAVRAHGSSRLLPSVAVAFCITVAVGIGVELMQATIGRDASSGDVWTDALGAACALGWLSYRERTSPGRVRNAGLIVAGLAAALAIGPLADAAAAYGLRALRMPTVAAFSLPWDLYFVEVNSASAARVGLPYSWARPDDPPSLGVRIQSGAWPGLTIVEPAPDWRGYRSLNLDLTNPGAAPLELTLRIHDLEHDQRYADRFNGGLSFAPHSRLIVTIPLAEIEAGPAYRRLDLSRIGGLILFAANGSAQAGNEFYVTRIWLE